MKDKVLDIAKRRGFIWGPSPNIYHGGVAGFYDWGPLGKLLKNKVESLIRKGLSSMDFWEVECPTIMPKIVWEASGHYEGFIDMVVKCVKCNAVYRADNLIKEKFPKLEISGLNFKEAEKIIQDKKIKCSACNSNLGPVMPYNLMMKTSVGLDKEAYLRPETATTTYLLFQEYYNFFRTKLPFGVFQIGKAYRNEISPRQHVLRTREFTQGEAQLFIFKDQEYKFEKFEEVQNEKIPVLSIKDRENNKEIQKLKPLKELIKTKTIKKQSYAWCIYVAYEIIKSMGFDEKDIRIRQHGKTELSHYADDAWDIEIKTKRFGWFEVCGIHDRTDYDLKRHTEFSKTKLKTKEIPQILEIAFGIERPTYCLLENAFREDKIRSWLEFPLGIAPIDVAVFPLVRKDNLPKLAKIVFNQLEKDFICIYDETGSIGRMYRRMDEIGTSLCCTIDHQSLKDNTVTIREISTMEQIRVKIKDLNEIIKKILNKEIKFEKAGKKI